MDGDGIPEIVVETAQDPEHPIYMINGYRMVKSQAAHRRGYDQL
jgi:hypothetical protein